MFCAAVNANILQDLHNSLCDPGITRMMHFIRSRNLPYSLDDIERMTSTCNACLELKLQFCQSKGNLIKATQPFERLNIDFKGSLPTVSRNKYLLTIIDEYSRFPFAFACADIQSSTVIKCFNELFSIFGMPVYIHSDRAPNLISREILRLPFQ